MEKFNQTGGGEPSPFSSKPQISEQAKVSLALSCVAALHAAFNRASSEGVKQNLLLCAADFLDRTVPFPDMKERFAEQTKDQVEFLIEHRTRIGAVPPGLWRPVRVPVNQFSGETYSGIRAATRLLKGDYSTAEQSWSIVRVWLQAVWAAHGGLAIECQEFKKIL